jgi:hypothetical protein
MVAFFISDDLSYQIFFVSGLHGRIINTTITGDLGTSKAKVRGLEAVVVQTEVNQQVMLAFQRWTGEIQSSKW